MAETAVHQAACAQDAAQPRGDCSHWDSGRLADALDQAQPRISQARPNRSAGLHPSPKLVLEAGARPRGLEGIVELPLQRFGLAHTVSFSTASFKALTAR